MKVSLVFHFIITLLIPLMLCAQAEKPVASGAIEKVVIDAGHGGKDPGTVYGKIYEKDINLSVALKLGKMITDNYPSVEVIYTRKTDVFVDLYERGDIANRVGADLFISIHVNAAPNTSASGSSTFVMGLDKSNKNLDMAMMENDVINLEDDYTTKYEGYVPGSAESFIIFSLMQYAYQEQSMMFSEIIQKHYTKNTSLNDRGAWQGPFLVLWRTAMPSVLTEMGFITNKKDREFLQSESGQKKMAKSLFDAFAEYKDKCENQALTYVGVRNVQTTNVNEKEQNEAVSFYVQIMTVSSKLDDNNKGFKSYKNKVVQKRTPAGKYRCLVGGVPTFSEAEKLLKKVKSEFKDAFIVAYQGDEYIEVARARQLTN